MTADERARAQRVLADSLDAWVKADIDLQRVLDYLQPVVAESDGDPAMVAGLVMMAWRTPGGPLTAFKTPPRTEALLALALARLLVAGADL